MSRISIIAAVAENRVIGREGDLPWHLPLDMKWFQQKTMGHPLIVGRKTFESFGAKPLRGREMIVISRSGGGDREGIRWVQSFDEAMAAAGSQEEIFIGGGEAVFEEALPLADRLVLTHVHAEVEGDTFFPEYDRSEWVLVFEEHHEADARHAFPFTFAEYERSRA
jgi:dihydrofolate reductase